MRFLIIVLLAASAVSGSPRVHVKEGLGQEPVGPIQWECPWDGVFPAITCDQFIECWNNEATLWRCTDLMLFDMEYLGCNFAQYVHCDARPRPTNVPSTIGTVQTTPTTTRDPNATTTESPPIDFDCVESGDGVFAHESRCEYFWKCYAGVPELVHCPNDFLFDLVYMGCNYPEYTHCQDRERPPGVKPTTVPPPTTTAPTTTTPRYTGPTTTQDPTAPTTTTTTTTPQPEFQCPPGFEGNLSDPLDCNCFYTCSGGVPFRSCCSEGLHYNPLTDSCDYPEIVQCQIRK